MARSATMRSTPVEVEQKIIHKRFVPLDVIRGVAILLMLIAEFSGNGNSWSFLNHAQWIGFTLVDLPFAVFVTCMGFAMVFSLKHIEKIDLTFVKKVVIRGVLLIAIGLLLNFFDKFFGNLFNQTPDAFINAISNLRVYGPLQRLGFVFLCAAFIIALTKKDIRWILGIGGGILFVYLFILGFGHGYENSTDNIIHLFDSSIFPAANLYPVSRCPVDPEGGLSMLPAIGQVLIAYGIAKLFMEYKDRNKATLSLFACASLMIIVALLFSTFCPIIKRAWTTSYALLTTGIAFGLIALVSFFTLDKPHNKSLYVFKVLGANALSIYIFMYLVMFFFKHIPVGQGTDELGHIVNLNINYFMNNGLVAMCGGYEPLASFIHALIYAGVTWFVAWLLYRKNIIIKL